MNKYSGFFAAYNASVKNGNPTTKEEMLLDFTNDRTSSLKELTDAELEEITKRIKSLSGLTYISNVIETNPTGDKMRKSIISIFKKMNCNTKEAIEWAEKQGVKGVKKPFNDYTNGELFVLIRVAEKVLSDWQIAIRKRITPIK